MMQTRKVTNRISSCENDIIKNLTFSKCIKHVFYASKTVTHKRSLFDLEATEKIFFRSSFKHERVKLVNRLMMLKFLGDEG